MCHKLKLRELFKWRLSKLFESQSLHLTLMTVSIGERKDRHLTFHLSMWPSTNQDDSYFIELIWRYKECVWTLTILCCCFEKLIERLSTNHNTKQSSTFKQEYPRSWECVWEVDTVVIREVLFHGVMGTCYDRDVLELWLPSMNWICFWKNKIVYLDPVFKTGWWASIEEIKKVIGKRGGAVVARQAHNLQVGWSKLPSAAFLKGHRV